MDKLKVAVIVSHPIQHFAPWHRAVAKAGEIDLRVFFCYRWGVDNYKDPEFGTEFKWDVPLLDGYDHEFLPIEKAPERLSFMAVNNPVEPALDRFRPDVLNVFGYAHRTNWRAAWWARKHGVPVLLYSDSQANRKRGFAKSLVKNVVVRGFYRLVDGAIYAGEQNREYHWRFGIPEKRLFEGILPVDRSAMLGYAPDRDECRREILELHRIPADAFVVMFPAKLVKHKSPLHLAQAAEISAGRGSRVHALFVGEGIQRPMVEQYCRERGVKNVSFAGFVNQSVIPRYYAASDAVAVTSYVDSHPLAVTEAACFGLPVVVSDRIGCLGATDTAREGVNAISYPWGEVNALAEALERLATDVALYSRMSEGALEISKSQDVTVAAAQLVEASRQLVKMGKR